MAATEFDSLPLVVRPVREPDAPILWEIEQRCFRSGLWQQEDFLSRDCLVADLKDGLIAGYLVSQEICPPIAGAMAEREILNLAVDLPYRRLGIGGRLLEGELTRGGIHFLEVRESNVAAQALYRKYGFREIAQRPDYYKSPEETAIVMRTYPCG